MERLDKIIASQGQYTRKDVKMLISDRRVTVNGVAALHPDDKVDPETDLIVVDGELLSFKRYLYLILHKPQGYISSTDDGSGPTVLELVPPQLRRPGLFPAGRLDKDTTGLMILTDDGQFAHRILSPRHHVQKEYRVTLDVSVTEEMVRGFAVGVMLKDGVCAPAGLVIRDDRIADVTLTQGRYHQIKRMFGCYDAKVTALHRMRIGNLILPADLSPGACRELTEQELLSLQEK